MIICINKVLIMTIGERIKKLREEKNMSVDKLAELIGKNRATIYRYESNDIEKLPTSVLEPLCKALGTTPAYLMGWKETDDTTDDTTLQPTIDTSSIQYAAYQELEGESDEVVKDVINFIKFRKSQEKNNE